MNLKEGLKLASTPNKNDLSNGQVNKINKKNRKISSNINQFLDQLHFDAFKRMRISDVDNLDAKFNSIMNTENSYINKKVDGDTTSFLMKLVSNSEKKKFSVDDLNEAFNLNSGAIESFISSVYTNRLLKYNDMHELSDSLNELREAILITRDSIVSADVTDGHISRTLDFEDYDADDIDSYLSVAEEMEKKFKLKEKTKNFVIPKGLEYGMYYAYTIPYSKIFEDFQAFKNKDEGMNITAYESSIDTDDIDELYGYISEDTKVNIKEKDDNITDDSLKAELKSMVENISVSSDPIPLIVLEEGIGGLEYILENKNDADIMKAFMTEKVSPSEFNKAMGKKLDLGVHTEKNTKGKAKKSKSEFGEIKDCYSLLVDPLHMLPVKILDYTVGYIYIKESESNTLNGRLNEQMYLNKESGFNSNERNFVDKLAMKVVKSFDKKFLQDNIKFKDMIVDSINYFNLNNRKIRYQFIPKEYVTEFKINEDEHGYGRSIIEPSLYYGKLYLMLLLFKMISIVNNSNDTQINYVKTSGINKNTSNKVQEIARKMQQKQLNILDMFSYTSMVNKVGQGSKVYMPVGAGEARGIETEILAGQDIQLDTPLLEMLKTGYISATGVPSVIMNYINEADYAKTLELANTRYQGRIVSDQLDFNPCITEWYKKLMRFSTNIPEEMIESFTYTLSPPKYANSNTTSDLLNNFNNLFEFLLSMLLEDKVVQDTETNGELIRQLKLRIAKEKLPMLNLDKFEDIVAEAKLKFGEKKEDPASVAKTDGQA